MMIYIHISPNFIIYRVPMFELEEGDTNNDARRRCNTTVNVSASSVSRFTLIVRHSTKSIRVSDDIASAFFIFTPTMLTSSTTFHVFRRKFTE